MKNVVLLLAATIMLVATACQRTGQTLDGRTCGDFGEQHWHPDAPLAIDARMQAREMRDDGGLAAAAFANDGAARRFGGCANAAHLEAPRNLRRTIPAIQGSQHALPQILRIGLHLRLPSTSRKYYRMKCIYVNRKRSSGLSADVTSRHQADQDSSAAPVAVSQ